MEDFDNEIMELHKKQRFEEGYKAGLERAAEMLEELEPSYPNCYVNIFVMLLKKEGRK